MVFQIVVLLAIDSGGSRSIWTVDAYASWLKCFIELDPDEIVMHHAMVPAHEAREKVSIEVQPYAVRESQKRKESSEDDGRQSQPVSAPTGIEDEMANDGKWVSGDEYFLAQDDDSSTPTSTTLKVRLRVPPSLQHEDVQWVVEAMIVPTLSHDESPSLSVNFIDLGVMCDGQRAFSRRHSEHVVLQIDDDGLDGDISLVAGWASGFEAVTLTPKMILRTGRSTQTLSSDEL